MLFSVVIDSRAVWLIFDCVSNGRAAAARGGLNAGEGRSLVYILSIFFFWEPLIKKGRVGYLRAGFISGPYSRSPLQQQFTNCCIPLRPACFLAFFFHACSVTHTLHTRIYTHTHVFHSCLSITREKVWIVWIFGAWPTFFLRGNIWNIQICRLALKRAIARLPPLSKLNLKYCTQLFEWRQIFRFWLTLVTSNNFARKIGLETKLDCN